MPWKLVIGFLTHLQQGKCRRGRRGPDFKENFLAAFYFWPIKTFWQRQAFRRGVIAAGTLLEFLYTLAFWIGQICLPCESTYPFSRSTGTIIDTVYCSGAGSSVSVYWKPEFGMFNCTQWVCVSLSISLPLLMHVFVNKGVVLLLLDQDCRRMSPDLASPCLYFEPYSKRESVAVLLTANSRLAIQTWLHHQCKFYKDSGIARISPKEILIWFAQIIVPSPP